MTTPPTVLSRVARAGARRLRLPRGVGRRWPNRIVPEMAARDDGVGTAGGRGGAVRLGERPIRPYASGMRGLVWLLFLLGSASLVAADPVVPADYRDLLEHLDARIDFERLPARSEPGFNLDLPLYARGAWIGERFRGQSLARTVAGHDTVVGPPGGPWLQIAGGAPGRNLSVAWHRGFGSNALFPLGPAGFPALAARGEGAAAILFDSDQRAIGFRLHTDYPAPLGIGDRPQGSVEVRLYARDGRRLGHFTHRFGPGISEIGYRLAEPGPGIAGALILNTDPGGIALDDIIFAMPPPLG